MKTLDLAIVMTSITTVRATAKNRASANLAVTATVAANVNALLARDRARVKNVLPIPLFKKPFASVRLKCNCSDK